MPFDIEEIILSDESPTLQRNTF